MRIGIAVLMATVMLAGCATAPGTPAPAEPVSNKPAVQSLVNDAQAALTAGRADEASRSLEHALRIEPRNSMLWHYLSQTRLQQGRFDQAESLAAKSNTLAGDNRELRAANWRLIAQARSAKGDTVGAEAARAKADNTSP